MPDETTILSLPLILPAQAQKHVTHNEALVALDLIVQLTVINRTLSAPPALPATGDRHIVAAGATGAWAGQSGRIALYHDAGWHFTQALPGWRAHVLGEGQTAIFDGLTWRTLSDAPLTVPQLGVAATADAVNRLTISSPATLLNHAGSDHQLKINKATAADTASLLFQTGFSGRAEMGTSGTDAFAIKVSANGSTWSTALQAAPATGEVTLAAPVRLGGQSADPNNPVNGTLWLNSTTGEVRVRSAGLTLPLGGGGATNLSYDAVTRVVASDTGTDATLPLVTGTSAGLAPASGGGTANFLRADGSWAAPGGGVAAGLTGQVQWNDAGAFAGAADVQIEGGQLRLSAIGSPTAPAAGGLKLFARSVAGRNLPAIIGPSGLETSLQPYLARNKVSYVIPNGNGTVLSQLGLALTATGTATAKNWAATSRYTRMRGLEYLVTTASATAVAGWRGAAGQFSIGATAAGDGGFHYVVRWGAATGVATATTRAFVGMAATTSAPTDVEPSSLTGLIGMGWDAADANIQFFHNDGGGLATKIDLGAGFPVPTTDRNAIYELAMFSPPGTAQSVTYEITSLTTGQTATGTVTTNLSGPGTSLNPLGWMSVGGTSSVIGICLFSLYIETDY